MAVAVEDRPHRSRRATAMTALTALAGIAVAVLVGIWALADPDDDPLAPAYAAWHDDVVPLIGRYWPVAPRQPLNWEAQSLDIPGADPAHGRQLIAENGCGSCHTIPGVANARGSVGPNLTDFADRAYVAGILPNRPGDLTSWLMQPTVHAPDTAMPDLGLTEDQARDMASYLHTLGGAQ